MHTTDNYQLSQWESADRILMESFNGDNQKIDAALKASADAIAAKADASAVTRTLLREVSAQTESTQLDMDVSQLNLLQYLRLELDIQVPATYPGSKTLGFRANGVQTGYSMWYSNESIERSTDRAGEAGAVACLLGLPREGADITSLSLAYPAPASFRAPVAWDDLHTLNFVPQSGSTIPAGTTVRLYGIRR